MSTDAGDTPSDLASPIITETERRSDNQSETMVPAKPPLPSIREKFAEEFCTITPTQEVSEYARARILRRFGPDVTPTDNMIQTEIRILIAEKPAIAEKLGLPFRIRTHEDINRQIHTEQPKGKVKLILQAMKQLQFCKAVSVLFS